MIINNPQPPWAMVTLPTFSFAFEHGNYLLLSSFLPSFLLSFLSYRFANISSLLPLDRFNLFSSSSSSPTQ
jgi:hypothetical protein